MFMTAGMDHTVNTVQHLIALLMQCGDLSKQNSVFFLQIQRHKTCNGHQ